VKKMKLIVPALLLLLGSGAVVRAHQGRVKPGLHVSGTLEARDVEVGSLVGGRVARVHAGEGESVKTGDPLVTLEADLLDLSIREQRGRVDEARARLALVKKGPRSEELARARVDWENAESDRQRLEALLRKGIVSAQQCEAARASAETRRQLLAELKSGSRSEDVAAAYAGLTREESRLAYLERQREETIVRAPADGVVQSLDLRPGDLVSPSQPVASLLEPSQLWVRVFVPETKLGLVTLGQDAEVTIDTFPDRPFAARVVEIGPKAEYTPRNVQTLEQRNDTVFAVKLALAPTPVLKPGMAVLATLGGRS
jgi:multidrug resistance efflux pump